MWEGCMREGLTEVFSREEAAPVYGNDLLTLYLP